MMSITPPGSTGPSHPSTQGDGQHKKSKLSRLTSKLGRILPRHNTSSSSPRAWDVREGGGPSSAAINDESDASSDSEFEIVQTEQTSPQEQSKSRLQKMKEKVSRAFTRKHAGPSSSDRGKGPSAEHSDDENGRDIEGPWDTQQGIQPHKRGKARRREGTSTEREMKTEAEEAANSERKIESGEPPELGADLLALKIHRSFPPFGNLDTENQTAVLRQRKKLASSLYRVYQQYAFFAAQVNANPSESKRAKAIQDIQPMEENFLEILRGGGFDVLFPYQDRYQAILGKLTEEEYHEILRAMTPKEKNQALELFEFSLGIDTDGGRKRVNSRRCNIEEVMESLPQAQHVVDQCCNKEARWVDGALRVIHALEMILDETKVVHSLEQEREIKTVIEAMRNKIFSLK